MPIQSINPASGTVLRTFEPLTDEAARLKIGTAFEAFRQYQEIPLEHRALWMRKLAGILEDEVDELATLLTTEMGKPIHAARQEVLKCASVCRYYAANAARILEDEPIETETGNSYVRWDPLGVVLAVMPWNFPFWQVFRFAAPALMAGNVALLKHASNVPQCALTLESLIRRAGFPRGTFQTMLIESRQVEVVLADERVAAVTVTGSETAGRAVAAQAGWLVKKSVLELGGSDPFIVMPSADLDLAIETAVKARCVNNGQSCIAAKRFIVADEIYEEFETRFVAGMEAMRVGDPMKEDTDIGPLATKRLVDELEKQVQGATLAGARILCGGERMLGEGNFFEPTVLTGLPRTASVYRDEIFGPVALLFRAHTLEEAIEIANDTPFGLAASVWTSVPAEQTKLIAELQCGAVFVNAMVASDPRLPFGGIKKSGYGRELSAAGMREFLNAKTVVISEPVRQTVIPFEAVLEEAVGDGGESSGTEREAEVS
ncbi:succinate-semialdehyde dehydrogenase / glutarate-semialdehyde dehydrogenase [Granulicella rosea]|uniref:Succinate-semialdehyde dehydrogenase / glutarate-semialdehyde dehydrogenase n=1 Tax=Granulicella rosea TaxID=474952 RepID=A0A239KWN8_9BACT|nr:NAD-dependent succinate-semialdehyde dehydrogenase [Granulicella rosea]SNT22142.1 succinate-semialdehyde dehydrogenase / glutarate-semialdehyde dehydrogenase [Granulicella rosea]